MKIISIHAQSFGKLDNFSLTLKDGVNVIHDVNGFGKTTLASFIRAMLYGFTYKTVDGIKDSSRFAPWQGAARFGGSMVVEHEGVTYRIERFFGATASRETLSVTNDKTGKSLDLNGMQVGEYFLGLTADSYDRSAYFPQEAVKLASNDNFDSRLANLIENGADEYDKIQEKLRAYKKNLRHEKGSGGLINDLEREKYALSQQQTTEKYAERRAQEIETQLKNIREEKQSLVKRRDEYEGKKQRLDRELAQVEPSPEQQRATTRLAELNEKLSRIPPEFDRDFATCDELAQRIENARSQPQQQQKRNKILLYAGAALAVVGVIFLVFGIANILGIAGYAIGAVCLALGVGSVVIHFVKGANTKQTGNALHDGLSELTNQYIKIARKYVYVNGEDIEAVKKQLWQAHKEYGEDLRERDVLQGVVRAPLSNVEKLQEEQKAISKVLNDIAERLNSLSMQVGSLTEERKNISFDCVAIEDKLLAVDERIARAEFDYKVADTVSQLLAEAKDNLSSSYLPKLTKRCAELLSGITQSAYEVEIDRTFNVRIREKGQTKEMNCYSRGIREITLLCFRIALSELLYDGAVPFIIIDDAFVNFDEKNFLHATELLKQLAEHAQVVYFTCHDRLGALLK